MTQRIMPLCLVCKHWKGYLDDIPTCTVFPDGIPSEAFDVNHTSPVEGDGGILFELSDEHAALKDTIDAMIADGSTRQKQFRDEMPIEEWADENICRDLIKADLHLFVQALLSIKHWVFASLTPLQSENLYTALVDRMTADKLSLKDLTKTIQEAEPSLDNSQAEAIARSESTLIVNKSREMQFERDPPGKYGYYWSGPSDHRTTEICSNIKARTPAAGFDSPEDLSRVIKEEAQTYYDSKGHKTQIREWLPHPNCRHTIISKKR